eukprot:TRINITY_DN42825_c0_g1_i1.p1 TRINITY_DN42825_c0_g1~~TRINITY_DN42825_c0_g1_i1.p1  ORF type:complete len:236 (-),score=26.60 TRINITY_DN42825_c0_g1_i1:173-826(-)
MKKKINMKTTSVKNNEDDEIERKVELALLGSLPESMKDIPRRDNKNDKRMSFEQFAVERVRALREKTKFNPEPIKETLTLKSKTRVDHGTDAIIKTSLTRSDSTQADMSKVSKIEYFRNRVFCPSTSGKPQSYLPQSSSKLRILYQKLWNNTPTSHFQGLSRGTSPRVNPLESTSIFHTPSLMHSGKSRIHPISPTVGLSTFGFSKHQPQFLSLIHI